MADDVDTGPAPAATTDDLVGFEGSPAGVFLQELLQQGSISEAQYVPSRSASCVGRDVEDAATEMGGRAGRTLTRGPVCRFLCRFDLLKSRYTKLYTEVVHSLEGERAFLAYARYRSPVIWRRTGGTPGASAGPR